MKDPTLMIHWLFSCLSLAVMMARLTWRKIAKHRFNMGDYWTVAAMLCCLTRLALIHVVLIWGTSNMVPGYRKEHYFTDQEIYQRQIGSKFSIANRFFYNSYLWLQKLVLLDLYRRLILDMPYEKMIMRSYYFVMLATYIAVQISNVIECRPVRLYWQILPDPGECAKAQLQLLLLGILNIVTDVMLIILPIPFVVRLAAPWQRKLQLLCLFTLGIFIVAITAIRLPINAIHKSSQVNRSTWASTELVTAAIVVNAPSLYALWNKHRRDKASADDGQNGKGSGREDFGIETIGGGDGSGRKTPRRKPTGRALPASQVTISELREEERHQSLELEPLPENAETASRHSSQTEILPRR